MARTSESVGATVTETAISEGNATFTQEGLTKYAYEDGVLYEYRYTATEAEYSGYTSVVTPNADDDTVTIANTESTDGVRVNVQKKWVNQDGDEVDPGDRTATLQLKRYTQGSGSGSGSSGGYSGDDAELVGVVLNWNVWTNPWDNANVTSMQVQGGTTSTTIQLTWDSTALGDNDYSYIYIHYWQDSGTTARADTTDYKSDVVSDGASRTLTVDVPSSYNGQTVTGVMVGFGGNPSNASSFGESLTNSSGGSAAAEDTDFTDQNITVTLPLNDSWTYTFPIQDEGYEYYVEEIDPTDVETTYTVNDITSSTASENRLASSGTSTVTNKLDLASVSVKKKWAGSDGTTDKSANHTDDTATVQLYKARSASGSAPTISTDSTSGLVMPTDSYEAVGDPVELSYDADAGTWTYVWSNLPRTETISGVTYDLTYYVKELSTTASGVSATYDYTFEDTNEGETSGVKSATITNVEDGTKRVQVSKIWTDGNSAHENDSVTVQLNASYTKDGTTTTEAVADSSVTLSASNNWTNTWDGLPGTKSVDGTAYDLTYTVEESAWTSSATSMETTYSHVHNTETGVTYATVTNTPTYSGGLKVTKAFGGLDDLADQSALSGLEFQITTMETSTDEHDELITTTYYGVLDRWNNDALVWKTKDELDADTSGQYRNITYADFTDGSYVVASTGLPVGKAYTVTEVNADGLLSGANYTLIAGESTTSQSASVPSQTVGEIDLTNTYEPVKGSITVTKNVTINEELSSDYSDVTAGQRFKVGLERKNGNDYEVVTQTITTTDGKTVIAPWVQTIRTDSSSTGSITFDGLELGEYRVFELGDEATYDTYRQASDSSLFYAYGTKAEDGETYTYTLSSNKVYSQSEGSGVAVNSYAWGVSSDNPVEISNDGGEDDKSTRSADLAITNDKTETGSLTVNKYLLYNGSEDTTKAGQTITLRLEKQGENDTWTEVYTEQLTMGKATTFDGTTENLEDGDNASQSSYTFTNLPYGTYRVYEVGSDGNAVTGTTATFTNLSSDGTYTVVGSGQESALDHANQEASLKITNSLLEKGSIKVTKQVKTSAGGADTAAAGSSFRVGLFTLNAGEDGADASDYTLVFGRTQTITVEAATESGTTTVAGTATFKNLDFPIEGATYYVFEIDEDDMPVLSGALDSYTVSYTNAGAGNAFTLTPVNHNFVDDSGDAAGATVTNTSTAVDLRVFKVDKGNYAATPSVETPLSGATFVLTQLDASDTNGGYLSGGTTQTVTTSSEVADLGYATFSQVGNGYYEVKETVAPTGYVMTNDVSFYFKVDNGVVTYLTKEDGTAPTSWSEASASGDILDYAAATEEDLATVTVGNTPGALLPNSGGSGTHVYAGLGVGLIVAALASLLLKRRRTA